MPACWTWSRLRPRRADGPPPEARRAPRTSKTVQVISVALIDFGNTLADETFMRRDSAAFPTWPSEYLAVVDDVRGSWDTGVLSSHDVATAVARRLGAETDAVYAYMVERCRSIQFYPGINAAVAARHARGGRQALVTVNPDLFAEVSSHYQLADCFDAIVTSSEEGTDDKVALCWRALEILDVEEISSTVLIDNLPSNVDGWRAAGGAGYLFRDDQSFVDDVLSGRVPGFIARDASAHDAA